MSDLAKLACEWAEQAHPRVGGWWMGCDGELRWVDKKEGRVCLVCGKPIAFKGLKGDKQ